MKNKKIKMNHDSYMDVIFEQFLQSKMSHGIVDKTIKTYRQHFSAIGKHLNTHTEIQDLSKGMIENMFNSMRSSGLSSSSIRSYSITLKAFLSWCNEENLTAFNITLYRAEEHYKPTYTDEELQLLLAKPNIHECEFAEYRNWVIINLLVSNGVRASSIRNIRNEDVQLSNGTIGLRHNKNKRVQLIPLCHSLCLILREYMGIRQGSNEDWLFPTENNTQMTENGLRSSIARYNTRRGVSKTSIHLFRHTFAKKYLVDCGGDAFTLQRLLNHATLDMTRHYCNIYNPEIVNGFNDKSPLEQLNRAGEKHKISM